MGGLLFVGMTPAFASLTNGSDDTAVDEAAPVVDESAPLESDERGDEAPGEDAPAEQTPPEEPPLEEVPVESDPETDIEGDTDQVAEAPAEEPTMLTGEGITPFANGNPMSCEPGVFYSVRQGGDVYRYNRSGGGGTLEGGWQPSRNQGGINGLGIGPGGGYAYAFERTAGSFNAGARDIHRMLHYDAISNTWSNAGPRWETPSFNGDLIAGAVDLQTEMFYFGGFEVALSSLGYQTYFFHLFEFNPDKPGVKYRKVGSFDTRQALVSGAALNGDMAFDAAGNLFVVMSESFLSGAVGTTAIFTLPAGEIHQSQNSRPLSATRVSGADGAVQLTAVNGIAFDSNGDIILGNTTQAQIFDPVTWHKIGDVPDSIGVSSSGGLNTSASTDLSTCLSPSTLTVKKHVVEQRVNPSDQFKLFYRLPGDSQARGEATTTGSASGLQSVQLGPVPVREGQQYTVGEAMNPGTANDYAAYYKCTADGQDIPGAEGWADSANVTIPLKTPGAAGAAVECVFFNSPAVVDITIIKKLLDADGQPVADASGWTMGASTNASGVSESSTPASPTKVTGTDGKTSWRFKYSGGLTSADFNISEVQQDGYELENASCTVTNIAGTTGDPISFTSESGTVPSVAPGSAVECEFTNKLQPTLLTLEKNVENSYSGTGEPGDWTLSAAGPTSGVTGTTGEPAVTEAQVKPGTYTLTEEGRDGYEAEGWVCTDADDVELDLQGDAVTLEQGDDVTCVVTNKDLPGSVEWTKVAEGASGNLLGGSVWEITGPDANTTIEVVDCTEETCLGPDMDARPGAFLLEGLHWGEYTAVETVAPPGYIANAEFIFTVDASNAGTVIDMGAQKNEQQPSVTIPLTGGVGTTLFTVLGGTLVALAALGSIRVRRLRGGAHS